MIDNRYFSVAFIADIHFGAMKSDKLFAQLKEHFIKEIQNSSLDMVVFGGDLFHSIISMNYATSHAVMMFMEEVVNTCIQSGIKYIRLIQGTMSHDNSQLHNFTLYENRHDIDFRIIMSVEEEKLVENVKILYVPEEYMSDMEGFYQPYLSKTKEYDFIFGHGMFKEVAFVAKNQDSEITMSKAPIFDSRVMLNSAKGPIFFGHIHTNTVIRKHIYYPGSFSRFQHGEETDKGFYLCVYDTETSKYITEFIKNPDAPEYITVEVPDFRVYQEDPQSLIDMIKTVKADYIKIKIVLVQEVDFSYAIQYLKNYYSDKPRYKLDIKDELQFIKEKQTEKMVNTILEKYHFIFDKSISHEDKIQKFIETKHGRIIPIETIKDELNIL